MEEEDLFSFQIKKYTMTNYTTENAVDELIALTVQGKWEEAFEKFYHQDLEKTDLDGVRVEGKFANLENGKIFASKISNIRDFSSPGRIVKGDRSFITWSFDFDVLGEPLKVVEVAIQDWKDGKIIRERFIA
jgi:hypothetical protein